eukprot:3835775-Rhodomonas_salina.1
MCSTDVRVRVPGRSHRSRWQSHTRHRPPSSPTIPPFPISVPHMSTTQTWILYRTYPRSVPHTPHLSSARPRPQYHTSALSPYSLSPKVNGNCRCIVRWLTLAVWRLTEDLGCRSNLDSKRCKKPALVQTTCRFLLSLAVRHADRQYRTPRSERVA